MLAGWGGWGGRREFVNVTEIRVVTVYMGTWAWVCIMSYWRLWTTRELHDDRLEGGLSSAGVGVW